MQVQAALETGSSASVARVRVMYWKEIPVQVQAEDASGQASQPLEDRFQEGVDAVAMLDGSKRHRRLPDILGVGRVHRDGRQRKGGCRQSCRALQQGIPSRLRYQDSWTPRIGQA